MTDNTPMQGQGILPCADCGQPFETPLYQGKVMSRYCPGCREKRSRAFEVEDTLRRQQSLTWQRKEWLESPVGIPRKYRGLTWDDFCFDNGGEGNRSKVQALQQWAKEFPLHGMPSEVPSLLLARDVNGVGKTMLASLILQDIINRYDEVGREKCPFQFWTVDDLKLRLDSARRFGGDEGLETTYRDFATMRLLILDDVGKESLSGYAASDSYQMYFTLINKRYNNGLPIVLTSNLTYEPWVEGGVSLIDLIGRAGVSRLMEMTGGIYYEIEGEDRR